MSISIICDIWRETGECYAGVLGLQFYQTAGSIMSFICAKVFYGNKKDEQDCKPSCSKMSRKLPSYILGPREVWMEFDRQAGAIAAAFRESTDTDVLCTFVYENEHGYRKFVVADPEWYWLSYKRLPMERRCSYEVIPEDSPSRLYLDLEYPIDLNPESNGSYMTNTLISIFCAYFLTYWSIPCNRYNVIDMDSSNDKKFSRHIIFNIKDIAFKNNYHVGRLVKSVCNEISDYITSDKEQHNVLSCFNKADLEMLLVNTKKGKILFVDTAVYTKNRHFRIYKSTKWGKQSHLMISRECKYIPHNKHKDKELSIFVDSLISYFPNKKGLILLEFLENNTTETKCFKGETQLKDHEEISCTSQYPALDKYIGKMINPGKIRLCKYFGSTKVLIYETLGYRYCENIGRCHKSNNIFLVVDLIKKVMYQKCHDEDCIGFKSKPIKIPEEIWFQIDEEGDALLTCATISEDIA